MNGPSDTQRRRGSYTGMLILAVPTIIGAGTIGVDLSSQKLARTRLQAVADIAAMAGTGELDGTEEGLLAAQAASARAARRNTVGGRPVELSEEDMLLGFWDWEAGQLDPDVVTEDIDSIQVHARRNDIPTSFAQVLLGEEYMGAEGRSTGLNPPDDAASSIGCYLPLAIPACLFEHYSVEELNELTLVLNPATVDSMGWGRVGASPNASWIRDQIWDCEQDGIIEVGDEVGLQNGVVTSGLTEFVDAIEASTTTWNTEEWGPQPPKLSQSALSNEHYGKTVEGAIIVFDGGPGYCQGSGGSFNGYEELVGFAWAVVYDVRTKGGASSKNLRIKLDTYVDRAVGLRGGGGLFAGVTYATPGVLVR